MNEHIVEILELNAKLLELHDGDDFKIKTLNTAAFNLDKFAEDLTQKTEAELMRVQGVGKVLAGKIDQINKTGSCDEVNELLQKTPESLLDLFKIKGIGVKKIKTIWKDLGIDNVNELRIACENGEIAKLKGFGDKIQTSILESIAFLSSQKGKLRLDKALLISLLVLEELERKNIKGEICGELARNAEVIERIEILIDVPIKAISSEFLNKDLQKSSPYFWRGTYSEFDILIEISGKSSDFRANFERSCHPNHLMVKNENGKNISQLFAEKTISSETELYEAFGCELIPTEMREGESEFEWVQKHKAHDLIQYSHLKGCIHNHSTWSDGKNTLKEMADACRGLGLQYFGIADHSQSATYAKGLDLYRVEQQFKEIDLLNVSYTDFKIFKGIESDILSDGSLDYTPDILAKFDYIVASVHQGLNMKEDVATARLIKAIENPYTTVLGHPTGRLLLSRQGYQLNWNMIMDACAANHVAIEMNASPYRLDMDWRLIFAAMEKGIMISINPDAHSIDGLQDMKYGVAVSRKGGLTTAHTLNSLDIKDFEKFISKK